MRTAIDRPTERRFVSAGRPGEGRSARRTDTYRFLGSLVLLLLAVVLDVNNQLNTGSLQQGSKLRYLLLAVPFISILLLRLRSPSSLIRKPMLADGLLLILMVYGLAGSLFGALNLGTRSTGLPLFLPMVIAFLYLGTRSQVTEREAGLLLRRIAFVGLLYAALNAVANSGLAPQLAASNSYRNAKVLFVAVAVAAALNAKQRLRLVILIGLAAFIFVSYPSATSVVIAFSTLVTLFVTRESSSNVRPYVVGGLLLTLATVALLNVGTTSSVVDEYFLAVGKQNNNITRLALFEEGIEKFQRSPLIGDAFTGETTLEVQLPSGGRFKGPLHDDYILLASSGGLVALILFVGWIVATEVTILRRRRAFLAAGMVQHALLLRTLLVGYNAWLCAALFNPVFQGMGRSATLFAMYGLMMGLGSPASATSESWAAGGRARTPQTTVTPRLRHVAGPDTWAR